MRPWEPILPHASSKPDAVTAQLDRLQAARLQPFDARTLAFLAAFAERILRDTGLRSAPELVALAYWFRPAAIETLQQRYRQLAEHGLLRPRGVAFHIAPRMLTWCSCIPGSCRCSVATAISCASQSAKIPTGPPCSPCLAK